MNTDLETFPTRLRLWQGAILGTIAHATWIAANPDFSHEQSWDGPNYNLQDSMGSRGTITFEGDQIVGVFFDKNSPRNPFRSDTRYDSRPILAGMPVDLLSLARDEALQYMLQEYEGSVMPIVTAAFWGKGERLTAAEPWIQVFRHGAHLARIQLQDIETAANEWQAEYELSSSQVNMMRRLFDRRMASPGSKLIVSERELDTLTANRTEGVQESRELLASIGIVLPNVI